MTVENPCKLGEGSFRFGCSIGAYSYINGRGRFWRTEIGRFCSIADDVIVGAPEHPTDRLSTHSFAFRTLLRFDAPEYQAMIGDTRPPEYKPTRVGNDVWIGARAFIRQGVTIGDGAIIGAHAVVTHDVQPYAIVAGVPARLVRYRFAPDSIDRLLRLQWWNYAIEAKAIGGLERPIEDVLESLESALSSGSLKPLKIDRHQIA